MTISPAKADLIHEWYEETQSFNYHTGQFSIFAGDIYFLNADSFLEFVENQFPLYDCQISHFFEDGAANVACFEQNGSAEQHTGISYTPFEKIITGCQYQSVAGVINLNGICSCSQSEFHSLDTEIRECVIDPNLLDDNVDPEECLPTYTQCEAMCFNTTRCTYPSTMDNCSSYVVQDYHDGLPPEPYIEQQCNNLSDYDDYYYYEEYDCHDAYDYGDIDDYELDQCLDYVYRVEDCDDQYGQWEEWNEEVSSYCPQNIDPVLPQQEYIDYCESEYLTITEGYYTTRYTEEYAPCMGIRSNHCWSQRAEHIENYNCPTCECKGDGDANDDWSSVVNAYNNYTTSKITNYQDISDLIEQKNNRRLEYLLWFSDKAVADSEKELAFQSVQMNNGHTGQVGQDATKGDFETKIALTNSKLDIYNNLTTLNQLTQIETTSNEELEQSLTYRIKNIPIIKAYQSFTFQYVCDFDYGNITLVGKSFSMNYNKICELSSSYEDTLGAISLLLFSLFSIRTLGRT